MLIWEPGVFDMGAALAPSVGSNGMCRLIIIKGVH